MEAVNILLYLMEQQAMIYICVTCGYIYPSCGERHDHGVSAETPWEQLAVEWRCPDCGGPRDNFHPIALDKLQPE